MSSSRNSHRDMTLWGISDAELLAIVDDLADENGWVTTADIRSQLGENPEDPGKSGVGPRLSWMRRYGWTESIGTGNRNDPKRWRLTAMGHALIDNPKLARTIENALANMNAAQRVHLARELGEAASAGANELRTALRRQWQRSIAPRR